MARRIAITFVCLGVGVMSYALLGSYFVDVDCSEPVLSSLSPEGTDSLAICRRARLLAMPGQASDAPGWVVVRDGRAFITAIVDLSMVQNASEPEWSSDRVDMKLVTSVARQPLAPAGKAWLIDRAWRMRAVLGLTPSDESGR